MAISLVTLGARVPQDLKKKVSSYCDRHGVKLQFFVTEALKERLAEVQEDELDNAIIDQRLKNPGFTDKVAFESYIQNRKSAL